MNGEARPILAVLCGELPPYRVHWHRRIASEIPEVELRTLLFPIRIPSSWGVPEDPALGLVRFAPQRPPGAEHVNRLRAYDYSDRSSRQSSLALRFRTLRAERREMKNLFRWLRDQQPAALVVNGFAPEPASSTLFWAWRHRVPAFVWADSNVHDDHARGWKRLFKQMYVRPLLGMASAILPCGRNGEAYFRRYTSAGTPMVYCPLEPDYAKIDAVTADDVQGVRDRFGLIATRKRLIVVCRLIALKRVDTVIEAFATVAAERPEWDLVLVGDGPERGKLEACVPTNLKGRVTWTGFVGDERTLFALYRACDVMVLASEHEAWALVLNEAAASGLAMVVSNVVGAAPELVREGENGRTFTPGSVSELVASLREVMAPERLERMKAASKRVVAEWRARADPIAGLRTVLQRVGVLKG